MRECDWEFGEDHNHDDLLCEEALNDLDFEYEDNYIGDDYYSGTGELIGDESYINYLNNY